MVLVVIGLWAFSASTFMPFYYTIDRNTASSVDASFPNLQSVLDHDVARKQFTSFLQLEFSLENLQFFLAVQDLKKIPTSNAAQIKKQAQDIVQLFVVAGSISQINLDYKVAADVIKAQKAMFAEGGSLETSFFDTAASNIYHLMERDSFPRFKNHKLFMDMAETSKSRSFSKAGSSASDNPLMSKSAA
jgi:regulator of G-protein signaling